MITKQVNFAEVNSAGLQCDDPLQLGPIEDAVILDYCKAACVRTESCSSFSFSAENGCWLSTCPDSSSSVIAVATPNTGSNQTALYEKVVTDLKLGFVEYVRARICADTVKVAGEETYSHFYKPACHYLCDLTGALSL